MLLDVTDFSSQQNGGLIADIALADSDFSTQRFDESIEAAEKGRLARSTFTDERNRAAGWNIDADIIERDYRAEAMRDVPCGERRRHALKTGCSAA